MSLFDSYDESKTAALNPENVYKPITGFPQIVLVTFRQAIIDIALEQFNCKDISPAQSSGSLKVYQFSYRGKSMAIYRTAMGAAMTAALMEEVIAMGGRKFVFFGSCGTLERSIPAGHIIVPEAAYRDEGTSYHYRPVSAGDYIQVETADKLEGIISEIQTPMIRTKVWTTDGLYRETRKNMKKRRSEGCRVVDMECAAIMAVAAFRGIQAYQFLYTEDNLDHIEWEPRTLGKVPKSASEGYLRLAAEIGNRI